MTARKIGINFPANANYGTITPYANIALLMSNWQASGTNVATDSYGNPLADAQAYIGQSKGNLGGTYNVSFNSSTAVTLSSFNSPVITVSNYVFSGGLNTAQITIPNSYIINTLNIGIQFSGSTGGIQNLKIIKVGEPTGFVSNSLLRSIVTSGITLRYLDATNANGNRETTWATRNTPSMAHFAGAISPYALPWEWCVAIANETSTNMWINIPVNANGAYLTNLANLLKYGSDGTNPYTSVQSSPVWAPLNSSLNITIEYGNEIWNTITPLFTLVGLQTATANIAVSSVSSLTGVKEGQTVYQGASLGAATWSALLVPNASTTNYGVTSETGTYTPGGTITNNTAAGNPTAVGGTRTATTDAIAQFLSTTYPNDYYGNLYRKVMANQLLVSEAFRAVWGSSDMPENIGRIRPVVMAQLGYDGGPLVAMTGLLTAMDAQGNNITVPGITKRAPKYYLHGLGCSYYYGPNFSTAAVTATNAVATGSAINFTYTTPLTTALPVGSTVTTSGFTFTGFTNGNYVLTVSSTTGCSIASTATAGASSTAGSVTFVPSNVNDMFGPFAVYNIGTYGSGGTYDSTSFQAQLAGHSRWAAHFGVKMHAYEGFWEYDQNSNFSVEQGTIYDSRMIPKILAYHNCWDSIGGDLACAYTVGNAGQQWNMVRDETNPTASQKYVGWLATQSIPRLNATFYPAWGQSIPGAAWAVSPSNPFTAMTPTATAGQAVAVGGWFTYVWGINSRNNVQFTANITATAAATAYIMINGVYQSTLTINAGTATYNLPNYGVSYDGPLQSVGIRGATGSFTINTVQST